jgi:hypothetical protein
MFNRVARLRRYSGQQRTANQYGFAYHVTSLFHTKLKTSLA